MQHSQFEAKADAFKSAMPVCTLLNSLFICGMHLCSKFFYILTTFTGKIDLLEVPLRALNVKMHHSWSSVIPLYFNGTAMKRRCQLESLDS
eukprot:6374-Heterococcus_DN1.PRE.1